MGAATAGRLGGRCDRRYLRGCQQQIQADGLRLRQVSMFRWDGKETWACVGSVCSCVSSVRTCGFLFANTCLVCARVIQQVGRNFLSFHFYVFIFFCFFFTNFSHSLIPFWVDSRGMEKIYASQSWTHFYTHTKTHTQTWPWWCWGAVPACIHLHQHVDTEVADSTKVERFNFDEQINCISAGCWADLRSVSDYYCSQSFWW